ncbi:MAG: primosomal protein N' [bacterium]|nr:primosomal protein N' [bacterium]
MPKYIQVVPAVAIPGSKSQYFTYESSEGGVKIGQEVLVPFRSRVLRGIVWGFETGKPSFKLKKIIKIVREIPVLDAKQRELALWIADYYHCPLGLAVRLMLPPSAAKSKNLRLRARREKEQKVRLTPDQSKAFKTILASNQKVFLLHGVTGSGKTEIYLRLCERIVRQGKQAIVLVPEISLTTQAIDRFSQRFSGKIALFHSRLTASEKLGAWERLQSGKAKIVIGPRSALFAPLPNLGLVILDEEHDSSFKQYDQTPRYHAREVAIELAKSHNAKVILGSATPSLESYYYAQKKHYRLLALPRRIKQTLMPEVKIIDMRLEFQRNNRVILSQKLKEELNKIIVQKKQAILFVNRRGVSTFVFCRDCGYTLKCPNCEVTLTYHLGRGAALLCHYCDYHAPPPVFCPECQSPNIQYFGLGTERVEEEIKKILPSSRIARFDRDATAARGSHEKIYNAFCRHKIDILVGTQMLAQGWDLPNVGLIGIIVADADLNLPDFRAGERTFSLLTQVAGRTGRGREQGKVILQTYNPDNFVISAAANHDYLSFAKQELKNREELFFPPFFRLVKLIFQHYRQEKAEKESQSLAKIIAKKIGKSGNKITMLGPAPAFIAKIRRRYRYHLILMFPPKLWSSKKEILDLVSEDWIIDIDPESLL